MFYAYCPGNNEEACGGKSAFEAGQSTSKFDLSTLSAASNSACTYDIAGPADTYQDGAEVKFRATEIKRLKVYIRVGDDPSTAKSVKGRRRLNAALEDKPIEVNKEYPVDLSKGKLNIIIVPDEGTVEGDTAFAFEYRVEGEKIPPPAPEVPVVADSGEEKEEEGGTNIILIAACGVLFVLVIVCCCLYMQYRNRLNEQKRVQQDIEAKLAKANRGIEDLKKQKQAVTLKAPIDNNLSSVGADKSHMES